MESNVTLSIAILIILIPAFVYFAFELNDLKDNVGRMYMNSASDYALRNAKKEIITEMEGQIDKVMVEIACLVTKYNADIQRVREGYKPGDVIEYEGVRCIVLKINHVPTDLGRTVDIYRLYNVTNGDVIGSDRDEVDKNSKFLRHVDLGLEKAET